MGDSALNIITDDILDDALGLDMFGGLFGGGKSGNPLSGLFESGGASGAEGIFDFLGGLLGGGGENPLQSIMGGLMGGGTGNPFGDLLTQTTTGVPIDQGGTAPTRRFADASGGKPGGANDPTNSGIGAALGPLFSADPLAPSTNTSTAIVSDSLNESLPGIQGAINNQILPTEQAKLSAQKAVAPEQAQLEVDVLGKYAPQIAGIENAISRSRKLSDAQGDLDVLMGPGSALAKAATELGKNVIDPEFFKNREAIGNKQVELVNSFDPNKLSGGERAEVERSVNASNVRNGNLGNNNATQTVDNAMHFGNALNSKRAAIGQALSGATSGLQNLRSGVDQFGRAQTNNNYSGNFAPVKEVGQEAFNIGAKTADNTFGVRNQENAINADRRDPMDRFNELLHGVGSIVKV